MRSCFSISTISLLALIACGPGLKRQDTRVVGREALVDRAHDAGALEDMMTDSVVNGGLWFDDADCAKQFGVAGEVGKGRVGAFARCVAGLRMTGSSRQSEIGDVVVMTYAPGFEVEARVMQTSEGPRLTWIGYASRRAGDLDLPTITHETLEKLRLAGDRNGPIDPANIEQNEAVHTWVKVCLDSSGAVTNVDAYETSSTKASKEFVAAAQQWKFRPFTLRASPTAACAMVRMAYPPKPADVETLPMPPPPSRGKRPPIVLSQGAKLLEGRRIAGNRLIVPDDMTKMEIQSSRNSRLEGWFRVCIDDTGKPESVLPLRSTGFSNYDAKIIAAMWGWRYLPYQIDDQPVPVCTRVTFIYSQR